MERLVGPNLEIVLSLNEGYDFGFLNSSFIVQASLDGNTIETNSFSSEQNVKFNSELVWASTKNNIKKMRTHKVPLRLSFFQIEKDKRNNFGYIIINLRSAQYISRGEYVTIKDENYKVCGLGKDAKGSHPFVLLSLRIQDVDESDETLSERPAQKLSSDVPFKISESSICLRVPGIDVDLPSARTSVQNTVSARKTIAPVVKKLSGESLQVHACHGYLVELDLLDMRWLSPMKDVHFRFHQAKAEVTWSAHEDVREVLPGTITNLRNLSARFFCLESPAEIDSLLSGVPPTMTVCTNRQGRPIVLGKASLSMPSLNEREIKATAEVRSLTTSEPLGTLSFSARLTDQGPQTYRQLSIVDGDDLLAERLKDELASWKEKERVRFDIEYNDRMRTEIARLQSEWLSREQELEKEAADRMEICRNLSEELQKVVEDVKEKEKMLEKTKTDLEMGYKVLVNETKKETKVLRDELLERLKEKDTIITNLQLENESLRQQFLAESKKNGILTIDQTQTLIHDVKKLEEKLESANHQKVFFREQWSRAVRELHRIKSEGWRDIQVQLQFRKDELKQLGLDQLAITDPDTLRDIADLRSPRYDEDNYEGLGISLESDPVQAERTNVADGEH